MRFSRHAWWLYLAVMTPVAVAYLAGPLNAGPVFNFLGFGACLAIVTGVRIHRPSAPWAWYLIAMGQFMLATGDVIAYRLARELEITAKREETMRRAADALVTATNAAEIIGAAQDAAAVLVRAEAQPTLLAVEERDGFSWLVGPDPRQVRGDLRLALAGLPADLLDQLVRRAPVEIPNGRTALGPDVDPTPAFVVPIIAQGRLAGVVALLNAAAGSVATRHSLESLAAQVGIALDSAGLTEHVLRSKSETRLSALVQHFNRRHLRARGRHHGRVRKSIDSTAPRVRPGTAGRRTAV